MIILIVAIYLVNFVKSVKIPGVQNAYHVGVGDKMSRRRSTDPTESIRITIPKSIHNAILDRIGVEASRSAWISAACRAKLQGGTYIADASDKQLLVTLLNRGVITPGLFDQLTS